MLGARNRAAVDASLPIDERFPPGSWWVDARDGERTMRLPNRAANGDPYFWQAEPELGEPRACTAWLVDGYWLSHLRAIAAPTDALPRHPWQDTLEGRAAHERLYGRPAGGITITSASEDEPPVDILAPSPLTHADLRRALEVTDRADPWIEIEQLVAAANAAEVKIERLERQNRRLVERAEAAEADIRKGAASLSAALEANLCMARELGHLRADSFALAERAETAATNEKFARGLPETVQAENKWLRAHAPHRASRVDYTVTYMWEGEARTIPAPGPTTTVVLPAGARITRVDSTRGRVMLSADD